MRCRVERPRRGRPDERLRRGLGARERRRRRRASATARQGIVDPARPTSTRSASSSTTTSSSTRRRTLNVGDHFTSTAVGVLDYNFGNYEILLTSALDARRRRPRARGDAAAGLRTSSRSPASTSRTSSRSIRRRSSRGWPGLIVDNLRSPDIVARAGDPGQRRAGERRRHRRDADVPAADRGDPGGRRAGVRVPADRPGRRPGRRRSRAATSASASSSAPTAASRSSIARAATSTTATRRDGPDDKVAARRSARAGSTRRTRRSTRQPQAARGRVPLPRADAVRDRRTTSTRRAATIRSSAASSRRTRVRRSSGTSRPRSSTTSSTRSSPSTPNAARRRARRPQRLRVLARRCRSCEGGGALVNLMRPLPKAERYSYVFEGNSQVLDQMLVSDKLDKRETSYDVVHVQRRVRRPGERPRPVGRPLRLRRRGRLTSRAAPRGVRRTALVAPRHGRCPRRPRDSQEIPSMLRGGSQPGPRTLRRCSSCATPGASSPAGAAGRS